MYKAATVSLVLLFAALLAVATPLSAQAQAQDKPAAVAAATPESAASFLGDWALTLQGANGAGTFGLTVKVDAAKVVGEISSEVAGTQAITDISTSGAALVLKYVFDYQGNSVPAVVTLTPEGDKVNAQIDFADGAYVMTGTAAKKAK